MIDRERASDDEGGGTLAVFRRAELKCGPNAEAGVHDRNWRLI
jgi:hypothetical protein